MVFKSSGNQPRFPYQVYKKCDWLEKLKYLKLKAVSSQNGRFQKVAEWLELSSVDRVIPFKIGELEHMVLFFHNTGFNQSNKIIALKGGQN